MNSISTTAGTIREAVKEASQDFTVMVTPREIGFVLLDKVIDYSDDAKAFKQVFENAADWEAAIIAETFMKVSKILRGRGKRINDKAIITLDNLRGTLCRLNSDENYPLSQVSA